MHEESKKLFNKEILKQTFQICISLQTSVQSWYLEKKLLIVSSNALTIFFSIWYKFIHPPLNPAIYRVGNAPNILCPRCKEQD